MKNERPQIDRLFLDRPLPETPRATRRFASLYRAGLDQTDFADSILRVFLALSLLVSLAVCGRDWSAPAPGSVAQATAATPAPTALVQVTAPVCHSVHAVL